MSIMSSQRLALKVTFNDVTKRLRDCPETFEALKQIVKVQMSKVKGPDTQAIKRGEFSVTFQDDTGDQIDISCDDDLLMAYDVAENCLNRQLKLIIAKAEADVSQEEDMQIDSKPVQMVNQEVEVEIPQVTHQKVQKDAPMNEDQIDNDAVKQAIQDIVENKDQPEEESPSEDSDEQISSKGKKGQGKNKGKKNFGGLPKKSFKKLIKKELDKQCHDIFNDMMKSKVIEGEDDQINSKNQVVHQHVACDGSDAEPIKGIRYKCSICKNFDFCATCEERRGHDHPFLKIYKPEQVPKAMFTVINENMKNAKADIEQNVDQQNSQMPDFFRNLMGGMPGRGMHHGFHRGGFRGGGWGGRCGSNRGGEERRGCPAGYGGGGRGGHCGRGGNWGARNPWGGRGGHCGQ